MHDANTITNQAWEAFVAASLNELAAISTPMAITMVVPAERMGLNKAFDSHLNRMLAEVERNATAFSTKRLAKRAVRLIGRSVDRLDRTHMSKGVWVGAYGSRVIIHHLDDEVEPQVSVSTSLNLMPLVRQSRRTNALVLLLTETGCRLLVYNTSGETLNQRMRPLKVQGLPARFHGEGGRQGREAGSDQRDDRYRQWMRKVAHITAKTHETVAAVTELPLVVVGIERYLGFLAEVSSDLNIAAVVHGSPDAFTSSDLDHLIAAEVDQLRNSIAVSTLSKAANLVGAGRISIDPSETTVWAVQGRIDTLVVEDDADTDAIADITLNVLSRAGRVVSAPSGSIAAQLPSISAAKWVAILRW